MTIILLKTGIMPIVINFDDTIRKITLGETVNLFWDKTTGRCGH